MTKNRFKWSAITAAFVAASLAGSVALAAQTESESPGDNTCNNTPAHATPLEFDGSGVAVVNGAIINGAYNLCTQGTQWRDIDFYSFQANAGEDIDFAVSNAWDPYNYYTWTILGVFGPRDSSGHYPLLSQQWQTPEPSISAFHANAAGIYYVGVSSYPGLFVTGAYGDGNLVQYNTMVFSPNADGTHGNYMLTVKGAKPAVLQISLDVKPGKTTTTVLDAGGVAHPAALRGVARGHLPVALLSSEKDEFYPVKMVDQSTLYFGATGKEDSLVRCNGGRGTDVNGDGIPDLICHFDLKKANFALSDGTGILTGKTLGDAQPFEGKGWLKTVTLGLTPKTMGFDRK